MSFSDGDDPDRQPQTPIGAIVGGVVGGIVIIILIILVVVMYRMKVSPSESFRSFTLKRKRVVTGPSRPPDEDDGFDNPDYVQSVQDIAMNREVNKILICPLFFLLARNVENSRSEGWFIMGKIILPHISELPRP